MKIKKKNFWGGGGVRGGIGVGLGGQTGCERRIKIFVKIQKKIWGGVVGRGGGGGGGVRVDVNEELKFFVKIQKKKIFGGGGGRWEGSGWGGGGQGGCERN